MSCSSVFLVCLLIALNAVVSAVPLTDAEKATIIQKHNQARCSVTPAASTMPRLVWDSKLEQVAQQYADSCPGYAHNPARSTMYAAVGGSGYVGENLAWGFPDGGSATDGWISEQQFYTYQIFDIEINAAGCSTGSWDSCGHYTQVIWAATQSIGCARTTNPCPNINSAPFYVCNYNTGGNVDQTWPYVSGASNGATDACTSLNASAVTTTTAATTPAPTTATTTSPATTGVAKQACNPVLGNYAANSVITVSSSSPKTQNLINLVDNDRTTHWSPSSNTANQWIKMAFIGAFQVQKIRLFFVDAQHTPANVVVSYKAQATDSFKVLINFNNPSTKAVYSFTQPVTVIALKIMIVTPGPSMTEISEVEVDAIPVC